MLAALATRARPEGLGRSLGALAAIIVGALAGGILARSAYAWLPVAVLLPPGVVVAESVAGSRLRKRVRGRR